MSERSDTLTWRRAAAIPQRLTTPAGVQANATLNARRVLVLTLNLVTWAALLAWVAKILSAGGWTIVDGLLFAGGVLGTPWAVLGFWNAVIGLWLLHGARDPVAAVAPFLAASRHDAALAIRTAVVMTVRNEEPARAIVRLETLQRSLDETGEGATFAYFVLSDTTSQDAAAMEEAAVAAWRVRAGGAARIVYRRRSDNTGFKAGNVRDFCEQHGQDFETMLPLDADSLMTGPAVVELVRVMQAYPKIGILQSLVVGMPSTSPFARIFQFGMRMGMRTYTMGQAWWTGDCGPYWGHNALVRIKPFLEDCAPPLMPGKPPLGGHVLSHDQVEAVLMRRTGYEVRVVPVEGASYEENPPDVLAFIRRDVRWCQGNMQYVKLLTMPGLKLMSRFQLLWAILMFLGIPAWTMMIALLPVAASEAHGVAGFPAASAKALYVTFLLMYLAPKIAGVIDVLLRRGEVARFGGRLRFLANVILELAFSFLLGAISSIRTTLFMLGLPFGKSIVWNGQQRDALGITWGEALRALWPQTLFGLLVLGALAQIAPALLAWSLPLTLGYVLAVPFAVVTASPALGMYMRRYAIAAIPEDVAPPAEIIAVQGGSPTRL